MNFELVFFLDFAEFAQTLCIWIVGWTGLALEARTIVRINGELDSWRTSVLPDGVFLNQHYEHESQVPPDPPRTIFLSLTLKRNAPLFLHPDAGEWCKFVDEVSCSGTLNPTDLDNDLLVPSCLSNHHFCGWITLGVDPTFSSRLFCTYFGFWFSSSIPSCLLPAFL